ncbi:hypothetical protein BDR26DRAFT_907045 [Obelidium mucronatum]|nr:hypothetical protein BDR26DRAFT_907045 [Obelidium mucronatum]
MNIIDLITLFERLEVPNNCTRPQGNETVVPETPLIWRQIVFSDDVVFAPVNPIDMDSEEEYSDEESGEDNSDNESIPELLEDSDFDEDEWINWNFVYLRSEPTYR